MLELHAVDFNAKPQSELSFAPVATGAGAGLAGMVGLTGLANSTGLTATGVLRRHMLGHSFLVEGLEPHREAVKIEPQSVLSLAVAVTGATGATGATAVEGVGGATGRSGAAVAWLYGVGMGVW